jgi:hypothetical protein
VCGRADRRLSLESLLNCCCLLSLRSGSHVSIFQGVSVSRIVCMHACIRWIVDAAVSITVQFTSSLPFLLCPR